MKKLSFVTVVAIAALIIVINGCEQEPLKLQNGAAECDGCNYPGSGTIGTPPIVNSFNPRRGVVGTVVTINGSGFSSTPSFNVVRFDGVQAPVISASSTTLHASVPPGATSGTIGVSVSGLQGVSAGGFKVIDIPVNGLVAFYPFDGNANDIGPNQLHGTVQAATLAADRMGYKGGCYEFNGAGRIVVADAPALQISTAITLAAWIKFSDLYYVNRTILAKSTPSVGLGYKFSKVKDNFEGSTLDMYAASPSPASCNYNYFNFTPYQLADWAFVAVTISSSEMRFYVNGAWVKTVTEFCPLIDEPGAPFIIGGVPGFSESRYIDDVAVYNRALTSGEIKQLFEQIILH